MNEWTEGISKAIEYIEDNLTEEIDLVKVAQNVCLSPFYFQKIFCALCGFTVGEYIRNRRLTFAAQELCSSNVKVIDVALKYGYDSPDSFSRAFQKFHGVNPSRVKKEGCKLVFFDRLKIKMTLEGGKMLEYKIVKKPQFTVMGITKKFNAETSYAEIPKFWNEHMKSNLSKHICGEYGVCMDCDANGDFTYMIADNYVPQKEIVSGVVTKVIPESMWAVFPCKGALPKALQDVNTKIWKEWLPSCAAYRVKGNLNIEMYTPLCANPDDDYSEIWIPIEEK